MGNRTLMKSNPAAAVAFLVIALTGICDLAYASGALYWFGNDARNAAMGGGGQAGGKGPGNLLVNPAMMSFHPGGAWIGFSAAPSLLSIQTKPRPAGYDVSENVYQADATEWKDRPVPTDLLTNARGATDDLPPAYLLNLVAIGAFGVPGLRVGIGATFPMPKIVSFRVWYNDEREQHFSNRLHFERFSEFENLFALYPAVSYAPLDWFSLGVALKFDLALGMGTGLYLPEGDRWEYGYVAPSLDVTPAVRPIAGLGFKTPFGLNFGVVYRHQSYLDTTLDVNIRIWSVEEGQNGPQNQFKQSYHFVAGYEPTEVALGAAYEHGIFSVEVGGSWQHWSAYLDRHGNDWTHPDFQNDGDDDNWQDPSFKDVFTVNGGGEVWVKEFAALRAGIGYYPSPMQYHTGRYNYVDNDLILYSIGVGFRFEVLEHMLTADLAGQLWHMQSLTVNKGLPSQPAEEAGGVIDEVPDMMIDSEFEEPLEGAAGLQTNNPGFPGYSFGGIVFNVAVTVGLEFN